MFQHTVQYYETDMMGITHHSNYIRFMEEARIHYMSKMAISYSDLEDNGIICPIIHIEFDYKKSTTFGDIIYISIHPDEFKGVKFALFYEMRNQDNELIGTGKSVSIFTNKQLKPIRLSNEYPEFYNQLIKSLT